MGAAAAQPSAAPKVSRRRGRAAVQAGTLLASTATTRTTAASRSASPSTAARSTAPAAAPASTWPTARAPASATRRAPPPVCWQHVRRSLGSGAPRSPNGTVRHMRAARRAAGLFRRGLRQRGRAAGIRRAAAARRRVVRVRLLPAARPQPLRANAQHRGARAARGPARAPLRAPPAAVPHPPCRACWSECANGDAARRVCIQVVTPFHGLRWCHLCEDAMTRQHRPNAQCRLARQGRARALLSQALFHGAARRPGRRPHAACAGEHQGQFPQLRLRPVVRLPARAAAAAGARPAHSLSSLPCVPEPRTVGRRAAQLPPALPHRSVHRAGRKTGESARPVCDCGAGAAPPTAGRLTAGGVPAAGRPPQQGRVHAEAGAAGAQHDVRDRALPLPADAGAAARPRPCLQPCSLRVCDSRLYSA